MIVPPGLSKPASSASSIIFTAMRSLIELPGLKVSSLATTVAFTIPFVILLMRIIGVSPMAVAPRQLPYTSGFLYFECDRNSPMWRMLKTSGGMAIHVAGEFPGLALEFWAIRS